MLIGKDFIFFHMPKTGGGSVSNALVRMLPAGYFEVPERPYPHPGWRDVPVDRMVLPALCYVRNPWDWYYSWYCFAKGKSGKNSKLWTSAFGDDPDFATFLHRACDGRLDHDRTEIVAAMKGGVDFYSARLHDLVGGFDRGKLTYGRFEHLYEDLEAFLGQAGAPVPDDLALKLTALPVIHPSRRGPYRDAYTDATRTLVERRCAKIIERFGYAF